MCSPKDQIQKIKHASYYSPTWCNYAVALMLQGILLFRSNSIFPTKEQTNLSTVCMLLSLTC